ncbi:uncharacterized protein LOC141907292 [Tubulanus polymorphus]|uniref:uncharacterized protein LOC141907292 n=1 Tax=Tubulanus polymorphus TaxID=672921 RepID=UPI003DA690A4
MARVQQQGKSMPFLSESKWWYFPVVADGDILPVGAKELRIGDEVIYVKNVTWIKNGEAELEPTCTDCVQSDYYCHVFGDCCGPVPNAKTDQSKRLHFQVKHASCIRINFLKPGYYWMINTCASDFDGDNRIKLKCENSTDHVLQSYAVFKAGWLPFKNIFCARCHSLRNDQVTLIKPLIFCPGLREELHSSVREAVAAGNIPTNCSLLFKNPDPNAVNEQQPILRQCAEDWDHELVTEIRPKTSPVALFITTQARLPVITNVLSPICKACQQILNPIITFNDSRALAYKNYYCIECFNAGLKVDEDQLFCLLVKKNPYSRYKLGLKILLDFSLTDGLRYQTLDNTFTPIVSIDSECTADEIFDHNLYMCTSEACLLGYERDGKLCRLNTEIYFMEVNIEIELRFLFPTDQYETPITLPGVNLCSDHRKHRPLQQVGDIKKLENDKYEMIVKYLYSERKLYSINETLGWKLINESRNYIGCVFEGFEYFFIEETLTTYDINPRTVCAAEPIYTHLPETADMKSVERFSVEMEAETGRLVLHNITARYGRGIIVASRTCHTPLTDCIRKRYGNSTTKCVIRPGINTESDLSRLFSHIVPISSSLSILSLGFTIIVFILFAELRNIPGLLLMNLCVALLIALVLQLTTTTVNHSDVCIYVSALKHYLWLVVFVSMSSIAVKMGLAFTTFKRDFNEKTAFCLYLLSVWFIPLLIVVPLITCEFTGSLAIYGRLGICWISNKQVMLYGFVLPISFLVLINYILFAAIIWGIRMSMMKGSSLSHMHTQFRIIGRVSIVLGLTWIVGFVAIAVDHLIVWFIFDVINSMQGVFIAVAFACNKRVLSLFKQRFQKPPNEMSTVKTMSRK